MEADGDGRREATLRPGVLAHLYAVMFLVYGIALLNTSDTGMFGLGQRAFGVVVSVAGLVMLWGLRRARVTVEADGITRRWLTTTRWRWDELSGVGPATSWPRPWLVRPVEGPQQKLVPWKAATLNIGSAVDQWFVDELQFAARSAGVVVGPVEPAGPSNDGSPRSRVAIYFRWRRRPPGPPSPPSD